MAILTFNGSATLLDIQQALDNATDGDIIELSGTFQFADGDFLYLKNGGVTDLVLRGAAGPGAIIQNAGLKWGVDTANQSVPVSATVENITFDGFRGAGIQVAGTVGENSIRNCKFRNYRYLEGQRSGAWPIRVTSLGELDPSTLTGTLNITGCVFEAPDYSSATDSQGTRISFNNLLYVHSAHFDELHIANNRIEDMSWMGFAIWGVKGRTQIVHNTITLAPPANQTHKADSVDTAGISFGVRPKGYNLYRDGDVLIEHNVITIRRPNATGILVGIYAENQYVEPAAPGTPREVIVRNNTIHMEAANNKGSALACLGACSDSQWKGNVITGSGRYGLHVAKEEEHATILRVSNTPPKTTNKFEDNDLVGFQASQAQMFVDATDPVNGKYILLEKNRIGQVSGSNVGNAPFQNPCAGIVSRGEQVELEWDDFRDSNIPGWHLPVAASASPQIGCIYLAAETNGTNKVTWWPTNFPPGTTPPPEQQILDLSGSNELVRANPQRQSSAVVSPSG